jgi:hypothetical protein
MNGVVLERIDFLRVYWRCSLRKVCSMREAANIPVRFHAVSCNW